MSPEIDLFPLADYLWFYLLFTGFIGILLAVDLGIFHRKAHAVRAKEAMAWSIVWVALALIFNYLFFRYSAFVFAQDSRLITLPGFDPVAMARQVALEFLTGYVIEYSLSVDNIFVFVLVFAYFAVPAKNQHRVLYYGILGAIFFRICFIALGSILIRSEIIVVIFGLFLVLTGIKMLFTPDRRVNPEKNPVIKLLKKFLKITPDFDGQKFFVKKGNSYYATPLLVTLVCLELTDIVFAVDSIPAIYAVTKEPLIVYTSNIFAILGLRSLYFLLANIIDRFHLLKYGLAIVLTFVGLKMVWLNRYFNGKFPIDVSLYIVAGVILSSVILSFVIPPKKLERAK